jgi:nucleoside-diphosphate-sugar epimerase
MTSTNDSPNAPLHVVLGGGQIGDRLAQQLAGQGKRVRIVQRTERSEQRKNITRLSGDITDLAFAERAAQGASVIYDCMNPAYHQWPEFLLPIARGALHGATRAGARLVALDCLYMYGIPDGPMREDSPRNPVSKKGALRVSLERLRMAAHERGELSVSIGRASDFFGKNVPLSAFGPRFYERLYAGKAIECFGDPDLLHSYTYADDVARGLAVLGAHDEASGVYHLPTPKAESTRALSERIGRALGREVRMTRVPRWMMRGLGLFSPLMREMVEMMYQWEVPYVLDDTRFREAFGVSATPIEQAVAETAEWARAQYQLARAA